MPLYTYSTTHQSDQQDNFHGTIVADPYRWLEDPATEQSRAWTQSQNQRTRAYLDNPERAGILERLKSVCNYTRWSTPTKRGNRYFSWKHEALDNQPVLYWQQRFSEEPKLLLNPNVLSKKGIVSIMNVEPSRNGEWLAYSMARSGSDWQEIRVRHVDTKEDSAETLEHTKFAGIAWHPKNNGFFYNRYPDAATVAENETSFYNAVYWHALGTDQSEDMLIYERPDHKDFDFFPQVSHDGKYLVLTVYLGTDRRNRIYYAPLAEHAPHFREDNPDFQSEFVELLNDADAHYRFLGNDSEHFLFFTDKDAPRGSVVQIHCKTGERKVIIAEQEDTLESVSIAGVHFVCAYLHHAHHRVFLYERDGTFSNEIALPTLGSVSGLHGKPQDDEIFLSFASFLFPTSPYLYQEKTQTLSPLHPVKIDFDASAYETTQHFCESKDGTRVPFFRVRRKDVAPTAETPTLMYGYGGFRHAMPPSFSALLLPWLEQGNTYCLVNLRGGYEYGTTWYEAGTLAQKQNVFDDFQAAGEHLVAQGWTSPAKLAIRGGSNGGLLVGACMLQRPDLFGAVVCQVPVLDMLRYHRFTIGRYWVSDYGNAETNPEHFKFMYAYSPLHNVKAGVKYPDVLITSADHDDRVVPAHAKKFTATLQEKSAGENLVLLRVDTEAGHGAGKPMSKVLEEQADIYTFLSKTLGFSWQV